MNAPADSLFAHLRTRTTDPATSRRAARRAAGAASDHRSRILDAIRATPGMTPREIAGKTGLDFYQVSRRLSEIPEIEPRGERDGCRIWFPKAVQP